MREQVYSFKGCSEKVLNKIKIQKIEDLIDKLSISPKNIEKEKKIKKVFSIISFKPQENLSLLNKTFKNNLKIDQSPNIPTHQKQPKINKMKYYQMLHNFKIQGQQNKIEIFHNLLYEFSIHKDNIVGIFSEMFKTFEVNHTSFQHEIGWFLKYAQDKDNSYAIGFFSEIINQVINEIPQYRSSHSDNYQLAQILVNILEKSNKKEGLTIFKAIMSSMTNQEVATIFYNKYGNLVLKFIYQNYDYFLQYMLIQWLEKCHLCEEQMKNIVTTFLRMPSEYNNSELNKIFLTKNSLISSIMRIINIIQNKLLKINTKLQNIIRDRVNLIKLQEIYAIEKNKVLNIDKAKTSVLIEEFKKMRLQSNLSNHQNFISDYDELNNMKEGNKKSKTSNT